jgi:Glycosyl hydrolases family 2/Glycosyl hydrolases family 2, TIM barrel domain
MKPRIRSANVFVKMSYRHKQIAADVELRNEGSVDRAVTVTGLVEDLPGQAVKDLGQQAERIPAGSTARISLTRAWSDPRLWSPEELNLYCLHTKVLEGDRLVDEHFQRFGFREFWIQGQSFYLNGRRLCLFGDWVGLLGCGQDACLRPEYCRAFVKNLKGMNYSGTRMQAIGTVPALLDACDELGLPIIATGISDSAAFFDPSYADEALAHAKDDMRAWLRRDRNHPSILIWSTENEDQPPIRKKEVFARYQEIDRVFLENDPTRPFLHDGAAPAVARSDMDGWAPILCPHYIGGDNSFGERLRELQDWRDHYGKPPVLGEENIGRNEDPGGLLSRLMGDRIYGEIGERDALWGWYIKRVIGAWRTYGVGGIIAHGNSLTTGNSPITATAAAGEEVSRFWGRPVAEFHWSDLDTPFAKPKYVLDSNLDFVNPWVRSIPETMPTPLYAATRDVCSSVLATLSRAVEHNPYGGEGCAKNVYLMNDGLGDIALFNSPPAAAYFVADAIPGVIRGFRVPEDGPWQTWFRLCDRETSEYHALRRRAYYWESDAAAVMSLKRGQGRYVLAALPARANPATTAFLAALLANLNVPAAQ